MKLKHAVAVASGLVLLASVSPAFGAIPGVPQSSIPTAVPSGQTPNVFGGQILAIAQVGNTMVIGGTFTSLGPPGSSSGTVTRSGLAAFDASTGAITDFAPTFDKPEIDTIVPDPAHPGAVFIGGRFKQVTTAAGTVSTRIASINVSNGQLTPGFAPVPSSSTNGNISDLQVGGSPSRLFIGGSFTSFDGQARGGLAALDPLTGVFDPYLDVSLTGHHNYGHVSGAVQGQVGAENVALNPAGNRLIVDGNFRTATNGASSGGTAYSRDQIVSINLGTGTATVDANWNTNAYTAPCKYTAFDSYVRDISWSPDGTYFVVATTGGGQAPCDSAFRFNATSTGLTVTPAWKSITGKDSLWSVAVTGSAVYVGGHQRWMNNPTGYDRAGAGAVPRPGLAALDPDTGMPLAWNPGRHPRGEGAQVIYPTANGIWVGSDTDSIGSPLVQQYRRMKIAFFPLAGGYGLPGNDTGSTTNPMKIFEVGRNPVTTFSSRTFDPTTGVSSRPAAASATNQPDWSQVHGVFYLNGRIWYGYSDGYFYYRTFNGTSFGNAVKVDPYKDPAWVGVHSGSVTSDTNQPILYDGSYPSFYGTQMKNVTAMFYWNKAIYYTLAGKAALYKRAFSPDTAQVSSAQAVGGVISNTQTTVKSSGYGSVNGMFVANNKLWLAKSDNKLYKVNFVNGAPSGSPGLTGATNGAIQWSSRALFISPTP